jgi:hypothetical protein
VSRSKNKQAFTKVAHNIKRIKENTIRETPITFGISFLAPHAIHVHEDLEAHHEQGQAKFVEQPLRENASDLSKMVKQLVREGKTLRQAILITANWVLEEKIKPIVPVDTGELRDSGKVKVIK